MHESMLRLSRRFAAPLFTAALCSAQDMIAVDWTGGIYALDSATGAATPIGAGMFGQNCLCRDAGGLLWTSGASGFLPHYFIARLDPVALTATPMFPSLDVRALAAGSGTTLYAITYNSAPGTNSFYCIDTATGVHTFVGPTGTGAVQAMTMLNGVLYAWDMYLGLGTIDPNVGVFVDVGTGPGANLQWLAVRSDGQLIGGGTQLWTIDPLTGFASLYAYTTYLRGAETSQFTARFGTGCDGGLGPVSLSVAGTLRPGSLMTTTSTGHTPTIFATPGFLAIGASNTTYGGSALPLSLDPFFGTSGCTLYVSPNVMLYTIMILGPPMMLQFTFAIPPGLQHATFYVQHLAFDNMPGGLSASNGVAVRIAD